MPLLTVRLAGEPTLADAARSLGLNAEEVDHAYGLIAVDPDAGLYALRVADSAADRLTTAEDTTVYADPRIGPAGPAPTE